MKFIDDDERIDILFKKFIKAKKFPLPEDIIAVDVGCGVFHYVKSYVNNLINYGGKKHNVKVIATDIKQDVLKTAERYIERLKLREKAEVDVLLPDDLKKKLKGKKVNFITIFNPNNTFVFVDVFKTALEISEKGTLIVITTGEACSTTSGLNDVEMLKEMAQRGDYLTPKRLEEINELKQTYEEIAEAPNIRRILGEGRKLLDIKLDEETHIGKCWHFEHIFIVKVK